MQSRQMMLELILKEDELFVLIDCTAFSEISHYHAA